MTTPRERNSSQPRANIAIHHLENRIQELERALKSCHEDAKNALLSVPGNVAEYLRAIRATSEIWRVQCEECGDHDGAHDSDCSAHKP